MDIYWAFKQSSCFNNSTIIKLKYEWDKGDVSASPVTSPNKQKCFLQSQTEEFVFQNSSWPPVVVFTNAYKISFKALWQPSIKVGLFKCLTFVAHKPIPQPQALSAARSPWLVAVAGLPGLAHRVAPQTAVLAQWSREQENK